ncbi:MAG: rhomboid family intramembrane serine protease [Tetrasphaera sp.]
MTRQAAGHPWTTVPITLTAFAVTAAVSVAALLDPALEHLLTRDAALVRAGQWWRLITPILVQPDGWGQFAFNLAGVAVVGAAIERRRAPWLVPFLVGGVASIAVLTVCRPADHGGGTSDCVASLIGVLALTGALRARRTMGLLAATAGSYGAFFCAYLALLEPLGVWPASIAGDLAVAVFLIARRGLGARAAGYGLLALVGVTGLVLAARVDSHGIGLLVGLLVSGGYTVAGAGRIRSERHRVANHA